MSRGRYLPEPVEVLEPETWRAPRTLTNAALRAQTGLDGRCAAEIPDKEDEE
jgi:hypothetical protein